MHDMTAIQQAHMIWYVIDGIHRGKQEASLENRNEFNEFTMAFAEAPTAFLQSKSGYGVHAEQTHREMVDAVA